MKFKTTKRNIMNNYFNVYSVGYCDLDRLLQYREPIAYTCGVYGWNADVYEIDGIVIVTGYRPFGKVIKYDLVKEYKQKANELKNGFNYEESKNNMEKLLNEFITKVKENK